MQLKLNVGLQDGCHGNPFKRYFFVLASILKKHCKIADLNHDNHSPNGTLRRCISPIQFNPILKAGGNESTQCRREFQYFSKPYSYIYSALWNWLRALDESQHISGTPTRRPIHHNWTTQKGTWRSGKHNRLTKVFLIVEKFVRPWSIAYSEFLFRRFPHLGAEKATPLKQ